MEWWNWIIMGCGITYVLGCLAVFIFLWTARPLYKTKTWGELVLITLLWPVWIEMILAFLESDRISKRARSNSRFL